METMLFRDLQTPCWRDLMRCAPSVMRKVLRAEATEMAQGIGGLSRRSNTSMFSELPSVPAWRFRSLVARLQEGREALIKARVAVHNFQVAFVNKPVSEGFTIASETYRAGEEAMRERRFRRVGLGFSLLTIAATMAGL